MISFGPLDLFGLIKLNICLHKDQNRIYFRQPNGTFQLSLVFEIMLQTHALIGYWTFLERKRA